VSAAEQIGDRSAPPSGREKILAAAVNRIASEGIEEVRIARIAMDAGVSTALVHYHFDTRETLLAEALEYSFEQAGDMRIGAQEPLAGSHAERLARMVDQCLPSSPSLERDWVLWVELWLRGARDPALRPVAARLYARLHAWFAEAIAEGIAAGELRACDVERMADRLLALIDGYGIRVLTEDPQMPLHRARSEVWDAVAGELGLPAATA
jgi:AcrR family transcriptional regulator